MKRLVFVFAVGSLMNAPAAASDFSKLGEPAFARSLLVSPQRSQEAMCAAFALYQSSTTKEFSASDAGTMVDLVQKRLVAEIGEDGPARELAEGWGEWLKPDEGDDAATKKLRAEIAADLGKKCTPLFEAWRSGGKAAFESKLQPSSGLIPLQSLPRCVAITEYVSARDPSPMFRKEELADLNLMARQDRTPAELLNFENALASEKAAIESEKEALELLQRRQIACLATFRQRAGEVGRTSF